MTNGTAARAEFSFVIHLSLQVRNRSTVAANGVSDVGVECHAPKAHRQTSPGQRPGNLVPNYLQALKRAKQIPRNVPPLQGLETP